MNSNTKFKFKKNYRIYIVLAYTCLFMLIALASILIASLAKVHIISNLWVTLSIIAAAILIGLVSIAKASHCEVRLKVYRKQIDIYRERTKFQLIFKLIAEHKLSKAEELYNQTTWVTEPLRLYTLGFLTRTLTHSGDSEWTFKYKRVLEYYQPKTIS